MNEIIWIITIYISVLSAEIVLCDMYPLAGMAASSMNDWYTCQYSANQKRQGVHLNLNIPVQTANIGQKLAPSNQWINELATNCFFWLSLPE